MVVLIAALLAVSGAFATSAVTASEAEAQTAPPGNSGSGGSGGRGGDAVAISAAVIFVGDHNALPALILLSR